MKHPNEVHALEENQKVINVLQTVNIVFRLEEYLKGQGTVMILCTPVIRLRSVVK